jgi:2-alkenal reductase
MQMNKIAAIGAHMSNNPGVRPDRLRPVLVLVLALSVPLGACARENSAPRPVSPRGALTTEEQAVVNLFEQSAPSVAYITTETVQRGTFGGAEVSQGAGSGFVWDSAGHIVTNFHVVKDARKVFVRLDAGKPIEAEPVGGAAEYDLAVLRLKAVPKNLRPVPIGTSRDLRIGQAVYAIGNPFGLQRTLTKGLVSALDRELPTANFREVAGVIQTDAAINPGNSGGPLLDSAGRLIGMNSAIRSTSGSSSGIGFAIPVDLVNRVVPSLINRGHAPLPLGAVGRGTPAASAGLVPYNPQTGDLGDVIVGVNGKPVQTLSTFVGELERAGIDATVELTVRRGEKERTVRVKVIDLRA